MKDKTLKVYCWGQLVGTLSWSRNTGTSFFSYNEQWIRGGVDLFPLLYPINGPSANIAFVGQRQDGTKYGGLPPFIADSLPDDWGSKLFADWAKQNHLNPDALTHLEKLSYIGSRGSGALEYVPEIRFPAHKGDLRLLEIVALARKISAQRGDLSILPDESPTLQRLFELGSSAGGRRPKAFIAINGETSEIRSGQIPQKEGFSYYILKVNDNGIVPYNEIEQAWYMMAVESGLPMCKSTLMDIGGANCFLTERYDRVNGQKVHTQSLAAMRPSADSYGKLLETCRLLGLPAEDSQTVFKQAVFNVFSGNTDDHPRNFEFILPKGEKWRLSPPYDLNYIVHDMNEDVKGEHCMSIAGKTFDIGEEDLIKFARDNSIRSPREIIDRTCAVLATFPEKAKAVAMPRYWAGRIERALRGLAPERFKEKFDKWSISTDALSVDKVDVKGVNFEMTTSGDIKFFATVGDISVRKIFAADKPEVLDIINKGGNDMDLAEKERYVRKYLCPMALKFTGNLDANMARKFDGLFAYHIPFANLLELAKDGSTWLRAPIYYTPEMPYDIAPGDKPMQNVNVRLTLSGDKIIAVNPYNDVVLGEALDVLCSGMNLDLKDPKLGDNDMEPKITVPDKGVIHNR